VIGSAVAIKILHARYSHDPEAVARFVDEARAVNKITHAGIVQVFGFGRAHDREYFVMELIDGRSLRGWLYAIAVRVASDYRRRPWYRRFVSLSDMLVDSAPDPGRASEIGESVRLLHELLAELPEDQRVAFVLGELEQLTAPEIAKALGLNLNTVYSRQRAARARFDAALARRRGRRAGA
jgi:RNA polymerase sigma factor (sigma-70 family)